MRSQLIGFCASAALLAAGCTSTATSEQSPSIPPESDSSGRYGSTTSEDYADEGTIDPITGYGDFSKTEYVDVDWLTVVRLMVECGQDRGLAVEVIPPGDGWTMRGIPLEQRADAAAVMEACRAGLNLPPPAPLNESQIESQYARLLKVKECLESEGYDIEEPPSLETFKDEWLTGPWHPFASIPDSVGQSEWDRLNVICPQP